MMTLNSTKSEMSVSAREREREREIVKKLVREWWIELTQIESKEIIQILGFGIRRRFQSQSSK